MTVLRDVVVLFEKQIAFFFFFFLMCGQKGDGITRNTPTVRAGPGAIYRDDTHDRSYTSQFVRRVHRHRHTCRTGWIKLPLISFACTIIIIFSDMSAHGQSVTTTERLAARRFHEFFDRWDLLISGTNLSICNNDTHVDELIARSPDQRFYPTSMGSKKPLFERYYTQSEIKNRRSTTPSNFYWVAFH